jgi:pyrimidine-nucleoside phosphorylase/thymidine phosphorylase
MELSIELAAEMVLMAELASSLSEARDRCRSVIADGSALERFRRLIAAQGGDPRVVDDPTRLPSARRRVPVTASRGGVVARVRARPIGHATMLLGAGRARVDSVIDPAVGVILHKKAGDRVERGEPLCTMLVNDPSAEAEATSIIQDAYTIGDEVVTVPSLIVETM